MAKKENNTSFENLPAFAAEYIKLVIRKMGYRKKVRQEVADELIDHFEAALKNCANEQEKQKIANRIIEQFGDAKLLAVLMRRAKKRCRPLWRTAVARTFQGIGVLFIFLIIYVVWFVTGRPVITTDYVAELNKLVRPSADDSLNAAPLYSMAIESLVDLNDVTELLKPDFNDANESRKERIRQWLAKNETSLALITKGSELPYYWKNYRTNDPNWGMFGVLFPEITAFHQIAYALCWRAWLNAENGRFEFALNDIENCYRFGRHVKGEKTWIIEQLLGTTIKARALGTTRRLLDSFKMDSNALADFQQRFQRLIIADDFKFNLQGEKLFIYDAIQRFFTESRFGHSHVYAPHVVGQMEPQKDSWLKDLLLSAGVSLYWPISSVTKNETIALTNTFYEFWDENMSKTPAGLEAEDINLNECEHLVSKNIVLQMLAPALGRIHILAWRFRIDAESTLVCIALVRYRQDIGSYPETLDKLVEQGYIKQIPIDPFSDKPIAYRKTNGDFLLYSFGENLKDDGGQVIRGKEGKVIMFADEGDWVFWPVEKN